MAQMPTPPFTLDAMRDELRTILLFTADYLAMARNPAAAGTFIGFESDQYYQEPPARVDLAGFQIAPTLAVMYDFAYQVGRADLFSEDHLQKARAFMEGAPRVGGQGADGGQTHAFMTEDGLCRRAVDTAHARWVLDEGKGDLSVRDLALLAGMTEGAVRNALAAAGIKAKGSRTYVDVAFARDWLAGRRGFIPTTCWTYSPDRALLDIRTAQSAGALSGILARRAEQKGLTEEALAELTRLPPERTAAWLAGRLDLDVTTATAIATALDLDPALVAGRAVELVLRQMP